MFRVTVPNIDDLLNPKVIDFEGEKAQDDCIAFVTVWFGQDGKHALIIQELPDAPQQPQPQSHKLRRVQ